MNFPHIKRVKPDAQRNTFALIQIFTGSFILLLVRKLYFGHPYYTGFLSPPTRNLLNIIFFIMLTWLIVETIIKYFFVKKLEPTKLTRVFTYLYKACLIFIFKIRKVKHNLTFAMDKETKTAFLAIVLKVFYVPIMLNTVTSNTIGLVAEVGTFMKYGSSVINFDFIFSSAVNILFLIDTSVFAYGYLVELNILNNRIRSVEPTFFGWAIALSTYPPFNSTTGLFLQMPQGGVTFLGQSHIVLRLGQILILLCHTTFVLASLSLGPKASNLTNRGIVSWGPYKYIRHPAYLVKLSAWFIEGLLYALSPVYFLGWLGFAIIYYLRAWTEERHLSMDNDYLEYKKKVKYMFIPKVF